MDHSGARLWSHTFNGTEEIPDGERCCTNSWAVKNYPLKKGGTVFIVDEVGFDYDYRIIVTKLNNDGTLM